MTKKVLFIGDLRTANNYGAIATTETLIKLLTSEMFDAEFKYIDYRSLYNPTPIEGFKTDVNKASTKNKIKRLLKKVLPSFVISKIINQKRQKAVDFVPSKFSQYESYYQNMKKGMSLQFEKQMLEWADIVYINGEGNIVNGTDKFGKYRTGARYILFMAWLSRFKYNLPTLIVNHTVDPNNYNAFEMIEGIYPKLDEVFVRETLSIPVLEKHNVKNVNFVPDALFGYQPSDESWTPTEELKKQIDFTKPYICLGDSSGLKNAYSSINWDVLEVYTAIIEGLKKMAGQVIFVDGFNGGNANINKVIRKNQIGYVNIDNCNYHNLYHVLKGAKLFISGRWHASIISVLANTPILCWGADSHKTRSLYTLLGYPYRFFEVSSLPVNIPELIEESKKILADSPSIKSNMQNKVKEFSELTRKNASVLKKYIENA